MKKYLNRRSFLATSVAGIGASALPGAAFAQSPSYKIGFLMPLTGGAGKLGQMMLEGSELAVGEINAEGGIAGKKIELLAEDSQALARNGIDGFRKLVDVNGAQVIITGWTTVSLAVAPIATESKIYLLSGSTASPAVRSVSPYFQSTWMYDDETVKLVLPYARTQMKISKLGVLTVISDLGTSLTAAIKTEWQKLGGSAIIEESHQAQEANFRPMLLKVLAEKPDAIYITSSLGRQVAQIIRQARDLGYENYFLSYGAIEDPEVLALGSKADKCVYTSPSFDTASTNPMTKSFVSAFTSKVGRPPNVHQANHYDLIKIIQAVSTPIEKSGKQATGSLFREEFMAKFPEYTGAAGKYRFNFKDGSVMRSTVVKTVKDGAFTKITDLS